MAKVDKSEIKRITELADIELKGEEYVSLAEDLSSIINYVEELKEVDTENTKATSQTTGLVNKLRSDKINASRVLDVKEATSGTEKIHNNYFVVGALLNKKNK